MQLAEIRHDGFGIALIGGADYHLEYYSYMSRDISRLSPEEAAELYRESQLIHSFLPSLSAITDTENFWRAVGATLGEICGVIGASAACLSVRWPKGYSLEASAGLGNDLRSAKFPGSDKYLDEVVGKGRPHILQPVTAVPDSVCATVVDFLGATIDLVAAVPFQLNADTDAVMLFFLNSERDLDVGLPIETEARVLAQVAPQIAVAYQSCLLYNQRMHLEKQNAKQLARRLRELESISQVGLAVTSGQSLQRSLDLVASLAKEMVRAHSVVILPYMEFTGKFDLEDIGLSGVGRGDFTGSESPRGDGSWSEVSEREVLYVRDTSDYELYPFLPAREDAFIRRHGIRSFIGLRLSIGERICGVMYANSTEKEGFDVEKLDALQRLGYNVALAIYNAREHELREGLIRNLKLINSASEILANAVILDLGDMLDALRYAIVGRVPFENFFVALAEPGGKVSFPLVHEADGRHTGDADPVHQAAWEGEWDSRVGGNGLTEHVIEIEETVRVETGLAEWAARKGVQVIGRPPKSWMGAPMIARGQVVGIVAAQSYSAENAFGEAGSELLETLAGQIAVAVQNSQLFEELEDKKREIEAHFKTFLAARKGYFAEHLFYDTVAHDIKNVLAAISTALAELNNSPGLRKLAKTQQRSISTLTKRVRGGADAIDQFLSFSSQDSSGSGVADLNQIVRAVIDLNRLQIENDGVEVDLDGLEDGVPSLSEPQISITMVVFNLVSNALAALRKSTGTRRLELATRFAKRNGWIELIVRDTGTGIRESDKEKIFRPFSSSAKASGKGVGLYATRLYVDQLEGSVALESRWGKGATFTIRFPASLAVR